MKYQHILKGAAEGGWVPPVIADNAGIPSGDMPGDKVVINETHISKAQTVMRELFVPLTEATAKNKYERAVIAVCGGSGVGKSEIASLLAHYLRGLGVGAYTLSGDNYPHRIPAQNDAERLRLYRQTGIRHLLSAGLYGADTAQALQKLQEDGTDAEPKLAVNAPWLGVYQAGGRIGLKSYLGTPLEINFNELSEILSQFKNGASGVFLKRMGRTESALWYDKVDLTGVQVMLVEWTHGNNDHLHGVDIPVLLNSTPEETLAHRRSRNRDGAADSPFTMTVLEIEQELIKSQARKARVILSKSGEPLAYDAYRRVMDGGGTL